MGRVRWRRGPSDSATPAFERSDRSLSALDQRVVSSPSCLLVPMLPHSTPSIPPQSIPPHPFHPIHSSVFRQDSPESLEKAPPPSLHGRRTEGERRGCALSDTLGVVLLSGCGARSGLYIRPTASLHSVRDCLLGLSVLSGLHL